LQPNPRGLAARIMKEKYFSKVDFLDSELGYKAFLCLEKHLASKEAA
jgi:hypothetical protein